MWAAFAEWEVNSWSSFKATYLSSTETRRHALLESYVPHRSPHPPSEGLIKNRCYYVRIQKRRMFAADQRIR